MSTNSLNVDLSSFLLNRDLPTGSFILCRPQKYFVQCSFIQWKKNYIMENLFMEAS